MSGYCLDCGNEMCVCNICECEECKPIPAMAFVSFEAYEKLQEQNKEKDNTIENLRENFAFQKFEFIRLAGELDKKEAENKIFKEALQKISSHSVQVGFYSEPSATAKMAREALEKVGG